MIDPQLETLVRFREARDLHWMRGRGRGGRLDLGTFHRWASPRGLRGVVLETVRIGGTVYTSHEALLRFFARLNSGSPTPAPTTQRRQAIARADQLLDDAGIA